MGWVAFIELCLLVVASMAINSLWIDLQQAQANSQPVIRSLRARNRDLEADNRRMHQEIVDLLGVVTELKAER